MARPKTGRNGVPVNIYLPKQLRNAGREIAKLRYGISLSELLNRLLKREASLKNGIIGGPK
jgi:hypothetical protein